ncbi:unnamed protein product [Amoebophrya sp. A120]|nr:unnamed protein product [Amoebophrya sp. A120]|eukprot:GSA120T00021566001.1
MTTSEVPVAATAAAPYVSPIAQPLVSGKLESKCLKMLRKAFGAKAVKRGIPEVTKLVRKNKKGVVIFAADVFPVDLVAHMPLLCEEKDVMYAYLSSRKALGEAINSKRGVSAVFVPEPTSDSPHESAYSQLMAALKIVHPYMGEGKPMEAEESNKRAATTEVEGAAADESGAADEPAKKKKKKEKKEKAE